MKLKVKNVNKRVQIIVFFAFIVVTVFFLHPVKCKAEETKQSSPGQADAEGIVEDFLSLVPDKYKGENGKIDADGLVGIKSIIEQTVGVIKGEGGRLGAFMLTLLGIAIISAVLSGMKGEVSVLASKTNLAICSVMILENLFFLVEGTIGSLREINTFFSSVIPISVAVNSIGVSPSVATTQALGMGLTLGIYSYISTELCGGVAGAIFISSAASSIDPIFDRFAIGLKKLFVTLMGVLTALVGAVFSLQSTLAVSTDSAVIRGAKYAISSAVPIVGSSVSGSLSLALGGAAYARGVVGGGAIAVVISIIISPLVTLLAYRFCLSIGVFFVGVLSLSGCERILSSFLGALDTLVAVYSMTSIIYIVELAAFLKGGAGLA